VRAASWPARTASAIGAPVFAIGNPHAWGWTHTSGTISQFRRWIVGTQEIEVIQTTAAINPGNSGGGLYDQQGNLIGVNTWTDDKRVSEGLGFAISIEELPKLSAPVMPEVEKNTGAKQL
jgi:serine protease Do